MSSEEAIISAPQPLIQPTQQPNQPKLPQQPKKEEKKGFFQRLFNF